MKIAKLSRGTIWGIPASILLTVIALGAAIGCAPKAQKTYISGNFVPAGMQQSTNARDPRGMSKGDPSVSASIKAHKITGLPGGPPSGAPANPSHP